MSSTSLSSPAVGTFTPEAFAAHLAAQPAHAPAWWLERKRAAHAQFVALPMPGPTDEGWRFSSRETLTLAGFAPATAASATSAAAPALLTVAEAAAALTFCDGRLVSRQALPAELSARGVVVGTLQEALRSHPDLLREHFLSQPQKLGSEKFAALHAAFVNDGAFILVPKGVEVRDPIVVTHASSGAGTAVFPHTLVILEEQARAIVVDAFLSPEASTPAGPRAGAFACGANDLYAGHGAQLTYVAAQRWSLDTLSFQLNSTVVRRDARVQSLNLHLGGRQARHESLSQLQAPGAFSEMLAVTVAADTQEFDQRTLQIHQAPHTKSDLLYKNALLDRARTTFSGLIVVDPDAQKTDAYQSNRNLMLSDDAEANSLPGLEIQANDVRCTHGATSSRIDPQQLFYLEARGIAPTKARELLVFGFFEEVLNRLEHEGLHESLLQLIATRFH
jgi:Fe-S cluster assembly protein SufD